MSRPPPVMPVTIDSAVVYMRRGQGIANALIRGDLAGCRVGPCVRCDGDGRDVVSDLSGVSRGRSTSLGVVWVGKD